MDDFNPDRAEHCLRHLASEAPMLRLSVKQEDSLQPWLDACGRSGGGLFVLVRPAPAVASSGEKRRRNWD